MCDGQLAHRVVVDQARVFIDPVLHRLINLARKIHRRTVGQMPPISEAHTQHGIAGLQERLKDGDVGARPGVGLHVGKVGAK